MRPNWIILLLILPLVLAACSSSAAPSPTPTATPADLPTATPLPTATLPPAVTLLPSPSPDAPPLPAASSPGTLYWPMQAFSETGDPDWAAGEPDVSDCSALMQPVWAPSTSEPSETLTLAYPTPVLASQIDLYYLGQPGDILRVEVQNSLSGLGRLIFDGQQSAPSLPDGDCPAKLSLPVDVDFEIDTILVTIAVSANPLQIDAVGLTGELLGYFDAPVFWRVPLPGTPVSLAASAEGLVYAVTAPKSLTAYDVEGNRLREFAIPDQAQLSDVTTDSRSNLLVVDDGFGWFILMSPQGEHLTIGGEDLYGQTAVSPTDGNFYILKDKSLLVYSADTAKLLRQMPLDETPAYASLAFDPQGRLFTLRNPGWQPELLQLDPQTGAELDAIPLARADQYPIEIVARDLAIDASGNFYILFGMNTGQIAIHLLDPRGNFVSRFGRLTSDVDDWPEGAFFDPRALAVSPDGRFILVADGYDETAYLTAFMLEIDDNPSAVK